MLIFPLSPKIHIPPIYKTTFTPIPELSKISTHYSSNLSPKSHLKSLWASLVAQRVESLPAVRVGDPGWIPGKGRTPGEGNGNPLQYSCLKKSHGQRSQVGYRPKGCRFRNDWVTEHTHTLNIVSYAILYDLIDYPSYI